MLSAQRTFPYEHLDMCCGLQYREYEEQHHAQPRIMSTKLWMQPRKHSLSTTA